MGKIQGVVSSFADIGDGRRPMGRLSIEGVSFLVPDTLLPHCPKTGEVVAYFKVQWRKKQRPLHWLYDVQPVINRPLPATGE